MMLKQSLWIIGFFFFGTISCTSDVSNPTPVYVVQGGEAVLQCRFGSSNLDWHVYNGGSVDIIASGAVITDKSKYNVSTNPSTGLYHRLHVLNVEVSDLKKYRCQAALNGVIQNFYLQLILIVSPSNLTIENVKPENKLFGTEDQDLIVSCKAEGGKPAPNVILIIDGQALASQTQTVQYTLTTINRSYDRKKVTCQASHADYSQNAMTVSAVIYLNLKPVQPTITVNIGRIEDTKPLDVTCRTTGSRPRAALQWTIEQKDVTSDATEWFNNDKDSDTYTVTSDLTYSVGKNDNGHVLTCKAVNVAAPSGVQTSTSLNVKYAPTVAVHGITYDQSEATRTVTCFPDGNPQSYIFYKWKHKSKYGVLIRELDGGRNGVFTLPSIPVEDRYQDSGEYVCSAGNGIVGSSGNVEQTGSGYVIINAQPIFTNDNRLTQHGEFGKNVDINVYVYSIPKYTTLRWYRGNTQVSSSTKYAMSDSSAIVNDTFHGKDVQLDGYSVILTVKNLKESDFNVSYRLELSYGVSQTVQYTVLLESASAPQTPINFTLVSSTDTSIVIEWIPGYNGGHEQAFNIQYRIVNESKTWFQQKIPQYNRHTYTLSELQSNTWYELRMFAENKFDRSLVTDIQSILTGSVEKESQTGAIIGGVAGGLIGVILLLLLLAAVFYFRAKQDKNKPSKRNSSAVEDELKENILYDTSEIEGLQKNLFYQSADNDYKPPAPDAEYAEVVKIPKKPSTSSNEYAEVQKPSDVYAQVDKKTQQKNLKAKKQKDKKEKPKKGSKPKGKALNNNVFAEYSNAELPLKSINDGEYANAEDTSGPSNSNKTTQGLEYADLSFANKIPRKGQKPKIHGANERTIYSDVDHTKRAPPLPQENPYEETNIGQVQK